VPQAAGLTVTTQSNCPIGQALCGFQAGSTALVFDASGYFDVFTITQIQGASGQLQSHGQGSGFLHAAGANVVEAETHTYYLDAAASQLRHYDGYQTDVPVADNVVGLTFDYFGDPAPPRQPKPPAGSENCLYDLAGAPKLTTTLAVNGGTLAPLPLSILGDGPWCGGGGTEFDADLLRVRVVRVTLRVQASQAAFRSGGPSFVKPGTSQNSNRYLPDLVTTFSVTPRNLGLSR
jgi:hypothetical protein